MPRGKPIGRLNAAGFSDVVQRRSTSSSRTALAILKGQRAHDVVDPTGTRGQVFWRKRRQGSQSWPERSAQVGYLDVGRIHYDPRLAVAFAIRRALRPRDQFRAASPCLVMDAEGTIIAEIDPVTRERREL